MRLCLKKCIDGEKLVNRSGEKIAELLSKSNKPKKENVENYGLNIEFDKLLEWKNIHMYNNYIDDTISTSIKHRKLYLG